MARRAGSTASANQAIPALDRRKALEAANASLRIEGLVTTPEADALMEEWVKGNIESDEMVERLIALHRGR